MRGRCAISIKILVDDEDFISKKTLGTLTDNGCVCIGASDVKATAELLSTAVAVIFITKLPNYKDTHRNKSQKQFFWLLFIMGVLL
jgi:hypothetical protein